MMLLVLGLAIIGQAALQPYNWATDCPWATAGNTGQHNIMKCFDGTFCNGAAEGWDCCVCHGGRALCPSNFPHMCNSIRCGGNTSYCCNTQRCNWRNGGARSCPSVRGPVIDGPQCNPNTPPDQWGPGPSCICQSVTDPHWELCNGRHFDSHVDADVLAFEDPKGRLTVNLRQRPCDLNPRYRCNRAFAIAGPLMCDITISGVIGSVVGRGSRQPKLYVTKNGATNAYTGNAAIAAALRNDSHIKGCPALNANGALNVLNTSQLGFEFIFPNPGYQVKFTHMSNMRWGLNYIQVIPFTQRWTMTGTCKDGITIIGCGKANKNFFLGMTYNDGSGQNPCHNHFQNTPAPSIAPAPQPPTGPCVFDPATLEAQARDYCKPCKSHSDGLEEQCLTDICAGGSLIFGKEIRDTCIDRPVVPGTTAAPTAEPCSGNTSITGTNPTGTTNTNNPSDCQEFCLEDGTCQYWSLTGMDCTGFEEKTGETNDEDSRSGDNHCNAGGLPPTPTPAPTNPPTKNPTSPPTIRPTKKPTKKPTSPPTEAPTDAPTDAPTNAPTDAPTPPRSCRDHDDSKKDCKAAGDSYAPPDTCTWHKTKLKCLGYTCDDMPPKAMKCEKKSIKFDLICFYDVKAKTCSNILQNYSCADYTVKKECKKLAKRHGLACKWDKHGAKGKQCIDQSAAPTPKGGR